MPVSIVSSLFEEPLVVLLQWRIMVAHPAASLHFVGRKATSYSGRVSSPMVSFDSEDLRGTTVSGRIYQLIGPDGFDGVSEYVWHEWCLRNAVASSEDVTQEFLHGARHDDA
ncbi:hypothetical protein [Paraburkholderia dilworthii]|uniref:hypothetical protein n=1 Tax=Paraburkholderia dilworthii TaxID=948106 RepID=UPI00126851D7|nr:hypothetical protein [Paraburkholderia dilworthii]